MVGKGWMATTSVHAVHYALSDVCAVRYRSGPGTLRRWCDQAQMKPSAGITDARQKCLSEAQLLQLARLHQRVVYPYPSKILNFDAILSFARFRGAKPLIQTLYHFFSTGK
jgi:hypothetical protein